LALAVAMGAASRPSFAQAPGGPATNAALPASAGTGDARIATGRALFAASGCGNCHTLGDAGAVGHIGPVLDGDPKLTEQLVVERVSNGSGPMPDFSSKLSDSEIAAIAAYLISVAKK
jgi:mono/diheme cytochrome c family protein